VSPAIIRQPSRRHLSSEAMLAPNAVSQPVASTSAVQQLPPADPTMDKPKVTNLVDEERWSIEKAQLQDQLQIQMKVGQLVIQTTYTTYTYR
jgi:hypothetical protein